MADRVFSYEFRGTFTNLTAGLSAAGKSVGDFNDKLTATDKQGEKMRRGLTQVGDTAGKIGLTAAAGIGAVVVASANFDKAMSAVQAATMESADNMDALREAAIRAGADTAFSASEAAAGIENLAKAGVSTQDILNGGLSGALDLAAAGQIEVADAAEAASKAMTQFGLSGEQVPHIADLLAAAAGKAAGDVSDFTQALNQSGLVANQVGLSIEETTAGLAAFASAGLLGSDAGTSFKTMLSALTPNSEAAAMQMERLGISAYDSQGEFVGLAELAGQLQSALGDMSAEQRQAALETIFGSDAVRAASVLYEQGEKGIRDWSEAVNDQGYAAETAATKLDNLAGDVEAFMGSLETALIGAGDGSQGALRSMVQGATDAVNAFNDLPGPIKSATTGLLGITAVVGGGLWFTAKAVTGVSNMRGALSDLGVSSPKAAKGLGMVSKAALGLVALEGVVLGLNALQDAMVDAVPGAEELTGRLLDLSDGRTDSLGSRFDELGDSIGRLTDSNMLEKAGDGLLKVMSLGQLEGTRLQSARDEIEALDQALAGLVSSGGPEAAEQAFQALAESYSLTADEQERLAGILPGYKDALAGADNQARLTADSSEDVAGALGEVGGAAEDATADVGTLADALSAFLSPKLDLAAATDAWQAGLRNVTDALAEGNRTLKGNTDAAAQNREAIRGQVSNLLSLVNAQAETGDGAKKLEGQMRRGYDAILAAGRAAGLSEADMKSYLQTLGLTPKEIKTIVKAMTAEADANLDKTQGKADKLDKTTSNPKVQLNTGNALGDIQSIYNSLTNLNGKTATTYIVTKRTVTGGGYGPDFKPSADGSTVPKDGGSYADRFPYMLAPGEEVISNRRGQADRFRPLLKAINNAADGATVGGMRFPNGGGLELTATARDIDALGRAAGSSAKGILAETRLRARHLERQSEAVKKELDASKAKLDALKAEQQAIKASVDQRLRSDIFGPQDAGNYMSIGRPDNWNEMTPEQQRNHLEVEWSVNQAMGYGQVTSAEDRYRADIAEANEMTRLLKQLKRKGLSDNVIGSLIDEGGIEGLRAYADATRGEISTLNKLDRQRERAIGNASDVAASFLQDNVRAQLQEVRGLRKDNRELKQEIRQSNRRLEQIEKATSQTGPDRTAAGVAKAVNGAAAAGQRRRA
ncbi:phage tail tape measure protein [uncultured Nocardioides sp.]|uniref:phage tail tape measure protein n=1 Tax=uncultured Nocardioides sp. TaxID=198441 RepID=UPI0030FB5E42